MQKLYRKHNCNLFDLPALIGSIAPLPLFGLVYGAIRGSLTASSAFLWIKNLASPDGWLTLAILLLTGLSTYFLPSNSEHMRTAMVAIQVTVTFLIVWKLAAGLGLYWASSSLVGLFQAVWLRQRYESGSRAGR